MKKIIAGTSNFQGMSAKNDSLLQIKEIVRLYANSKYLDRNVRLVLFILTEYIFAFSCMYRLCYMYIARLPIELREDMPIIQFTTFFHADESA